LRHCFRISAPKWAVDRTKNRLSINTLDAIILANRRAVEEALLFRVSAPKNRSGIDTLGHCFRASAPKWAVDGTKNRLGIDTLEAIIVANRQGCGI
jgi:hypothetical protein